MNVIDVLGARAPHLAELTLRRYRIGELDGTAGESVGRHLGSCQPCRDRLSQLDDEQLTFERAIPYERFSGGVEQARRVPRPYAGQRTWVAVATGLAAAAALVLVVLRPGGDPETRNRIKGADLTATARIAAADGSQRGIDPGAVAALRPGDRVRLGHRSGQTRHLVAVALDAQGAVTPLYPPSGPALRVAPSNAFTFLPDSLEFTGAGEERVFLLFGDRAFSTEQVIRAVTDAFQRAGQRMVDVQPRVDGVDETFSWTFRKP